MGPTLDRHMELGPTSLTTRGVLGQTLAVGPTFSAAFLGGTVAVFAGFNTPLAVLLARPGDTGARLRARALRSPLRRRGWRP
jgi:hypothetical protein